MTVIVTMDQNRRKIKMRNKGKQDKIVLGCDYDVSYVILPNVKCCSCQKRARFSRKAGSATQKKSRNRSKEKSEDGQKKIRVGQKKPQRLLRVKANVDFFWSEHVCESSPKLFRKFFCSQRMDFAKQVPILFSGKQ